MKTAFNVFKLNEKDNMFTVVGKGLLEGVIQGALVWGTIGGAAILIGKLIQEDEKVEELEETEEA